MLETTLLKTDSLQLEFIESYRTGNMTLDELLSYGFDRRDYKTNEFDIDSSTIAVNSRDFNTKEYNCHFNSLYLLLLKEGIVDFSDLVQFFIKIDEYDQLLKQYKFFDTLDKFELLTDQNVRELYENIKSSRELFEACKTFPLMRKILQVDAELFNNLLAQFDFTSASQLNVLLYTLQSVDKTILRHESSQPILRRIFDSVNSYEKLQYLHDAENVLQSLKETSSISYDDFVQKYRQCDRASMLFRTDVLSSFIQDFTDDERNRRIVELSELIEEEEVTSLQNHKASIVVYVCSNLEVINELFKNFDAIYNLNELFVKKTLAGSSTLKKDNISSIFELVDSFVHHRSVIDSELSGSSNVNEELLNTSKLIDYILNFNDGTKAEKSELHALIVSSDKARNTLMQLIDNHLQDQYDFEQLKKLLMKDDGKKKIKFNC